MKYYNYYEITNKLKNNIAESLRRRNEWEKGTPEYDYWDGKFCAFCEALEVMLENTDV
jgi:hypothetical protein